MAVYSPDSMTTHARQTLPSPSKVQPATGDPTLNLCTRYPLWLDEPGNVEYKVCLTLLHMASNTGNRTSQTC